MCLVRPRNVTDFFKLFSEKNPTTTTTAATRTIKEQQTTRAKITSSLLNAMYVEKNVPVNPKVNDY